MDCIFVSMPASIVLPSINASKSNNQSVPVTNRYVHDKVD